MKNQENKKQHQSFSSYRRTAGIRGLIIICCLFMISALNAQNQEKLNDKSLYTDSLSLFQEKMTIAVGVDILDAFNGSLRLSNEKVQYGIGFGFFSRDEESKISGSVDIFLHYGKPSKYSKRPSRYLKIGLGFYRYENTYRIVEHIGMNLRLGRELYFSPKVGFQLELGLFMGFPREIEKKQRICHDFWGVYTIECIDFAPSPFLPSLGFALFYRI